MCMSSEYIYRINTDKIANQPKSLPHNFTLVPLRNHFTKTPNPIASNRLIDLPSTDFLDTEEEITIIAAALYVLSVEYDKLDEKDRPTDAEGVRKWIIKHREMVVNKLAGKIEPPFSMSFPFCFGGGGRVRADGFSCFYH